VVRVFDAPNAHLALASFSRYRFPAPAEERTVKWAQLIPAESHDVRLIGLGAFDVIRICRKLDRLLQQTETSEKPLFSGVRASSQESRCRARRRHCG
jgi:hypothetical protein